MEVKVTYKARMTLYLELFFDMYKYMVIIVSGLLSILKTSLDLKEFISYFLAHLLILSETALIICFIASICLMLKNKEFGRFVQLTVNKDGINEKSDDRIITTIKWNQVKKYYFNKRNIKVRFTSDKNKIWIITKKDLGHENFEKLKVIIKENVK